MTASPDPVARAGDAQRRAAHPGASVWVAASAGSGKTKVLVDRVLRLLLSGTAPHRILCLTYTKAAAAVMRARVDRRLATWAVCSDADLVAVLTDLYGSPPDSETIRTARRLFGAVIDAPGGPHFATLHAFCQSLLKRFPAEAGIAPHFDLMDDAEQRNVLHEAREQVLLRARDDDELWQALAVLVEHVDEVRFTDLIAKAMSHRTRLRRAIDAAGGIDAYVAALDGRLGVSPGETEEDLLHAACRDDAFDGPALRAAASRMIEEGSTRDIGRGEAIAAWLADRDGRVESWDDYWRAFLKADGTPFKDRLTKALRESYPDSDEAMSVETARVLAVEKMRNRLVLARSSAALARLAVAIIAAYDEMKRARARMDYDDLIEGALKLLERPEDVAWVMFKLDEGIDHILIDEAQDTNPAQWDIVTSLAGDFFSGQGRETGNRTRTVFAVGDVKQSIYSFQGADPSGFARTRDDFAARVAAARHKWDSVALDVSFRSTAPVLKAVDAVLADAAGIGEMGDALRHVASRLGDGGLVELWPLPPVPGEEEIEIWAEPVVAESAHDPVARIAQLIAARIAAWLSDGDRLVSKNRPVRAGDIVILVRRRGRFMAEMVRALKQAGVAVAGADRMRVTEQLAVMDLMALGDFVLMPGDDLTLATVLRGPLIGLGEDDLFDLAYGRGQETLWSALTRRRDENPAFAAARNILAGLLRETDFIPPYDFYAGILGRLRGREKLLARLGQEADDPIQEFLNLALEFERGHVPTLQGFLAWLAAGEAEVKREAEQHGRDAVRVMTVHGAKGLEAPIVFLPDTVAVPRADGMQIFQTEDVLLWPPRKQFDNEATETLRANAEERRKEEYNRLFYVAMTRAEDRLYICGWRGSQEPAETCWYSMAAAALPRIAENVPFDDGALIPDGWGGDKWRLEVAQTASVEPRPEDALPDAAGASAAWLHEPAKAEKTPPRPLAPSRPAAEPAALSPFGDDRGARFRRGLLIHRLFEWLPDLSPERRAAAARDWLSRPVHGLSAVERGEIAEATLTVLADPAFAPVFAVGSRAEVPLTGIVGERVVSAQIDRLIVGEDSVLIVDYKTNRPAPRDHDDVSPVYLAQLAAYRALLADIYPDKSIRCALLWTDGPRLMEIPGDRLDRHAP